MPLENAAAGSVMAEFYTAQLTTLVSSICSSGILRSAEDIETLRKAQSTMQKLLSRCDTTGENTKATKMSFKGSRDSGRSVAESVSLPAGISISAPKVEAEESSSLTSEVMPDEGANNQAMDGVSDVTPAWEAKAVPPSSGKIVPLNDSSPSERRRDSLLQKHMSIRFKQVKEGMMRQKITKVLSCKEAVPVIPVDNVSRFFWDLYMTCLIMYYAIYVPYRLGFSVCPGSQTLEHFFTACFAWDIFIQFNGAVKVKGEIVSDRMGIAKEYLSSGWFFIDFVATVPWDVIATGDDTCVEGAGAGGGEVSKLGKLARIFRLLRIFKLLRLLKLAKIVGRFQQNMQLNPTIIMLVKTLFFMALMLHIAACGYMGFVNNQQKRTVGTVDFCKPDSIGFENSDGVLCTSRLDDASEEWIPPDYIMRGSLSEQYAYAFFWAISACTGIGWDIIPGNSYEVFYSTFMILMGMVTYIGVLGSVSAIMNQMNLKNQKRKTKMDSIFAYLKTAHVTKVLKRDIQDFYDFVWMDSVGGEDGRAFIEDLPHSLKVRLVAEIHRELLDKLSIFNDMTPEATFHLVSVWKKVIFMPTDVIISEGTFSNVLFILVRGRVRLTIQSGFFRVTMMELDEGEFFGESGILSDTPVKQVASVRALGYCELLSINKSTYHEMRKKFPMSGLAYDELKREMKRRKARALWKQAFMKVKAVNRLMRASKSQK